MQSLEILGRLNLSKLILKSPILYSVLLLEENWLRPVERSSKNLLI